MKLPPILYICEPFNLEKSVSEGVIKLLLFLSFSYYSGVKSSPNLRILSSRFSILSYKHLGKKVNGTDFLLEICRIGEGDKSSSLKVSNLILNQL